MGSPVIAIGLDAADSQIVQKWMASGYLPNLAQLRAQGVYGDLDCGTHNISETTWTTFFTGCLPQKTGFWSQIKFNETNYTWKKCTYDYKEYAPFYALGKDYRIAAFDLPQATIVDDVDGIQALAWGTHSAQTPSISKPVDLLQELREKFGSHPALNRDHARIWQKESLRRLHRRLKDGLELRRQICLELLGQDDWDLFLTVFAETHSGGHYFYHLSQPSHPLYEHFKRLLGDKDPLLDIYQATDAAIGEILVKAPPQARVIVFSQEGMVANNLDLTGMFFLPELLYRFNFPGHSGFGDEWHASNTPPPAMVTKPRSLGWVRAAWATRTEPNPIRRFIRKNLLMELANMAEQVLGPAPGPQYPYRFRPYHQPALWYSPFWPAMRAFALPTFCDGYIRINLRGRERNGIVESTEYEAICDELTRHVFALKDPRTQKPIVSDVVRTRSAAEAGDPAGPDGDLIVIWDNNVPCDLVDSPIFGRMGPIPYRRTGGHSPSGFFIAKGPGIAPGTPQRNGDLVDLPATILEFLGAPVPEYMDGKPLVSLS